MDAQTGSPDQSHPLARYVPLAIWVLAVVVAFLIPLKILSLGYLPSDDAGRHVAKALSGKSWPEIILLREGFGGDEHPGWHSILAALHRWFNLDADQLVAFAVAAPFVLFWLVMLVFRKRPEAVLLTLFLAALFGGGTFNRLFLGRPFVVMTMVAMILLRLWTGPAKISAWQVLLSTVLVGVSVWIHGSWYLFGMVVVGFAVVGQWRRSLGLAGCWLAGTLLGATFTGHPFAYLDQTTRHLWFTVFGETALDRMLVLELAPDPGDLAMVAAVLLLLLWRFIRGEWKNEVVCNPLFALAALGWLLGLKVSRFWMDWGFPALLLWMVTEFETVLESRLNRESVKALGLAAFATVGVYLTTIRDNANQWTTSLTIEYLTPDNPDLAGWLPEKGGLVYSSEMEVFFRTFYKNPKADWRYVLGFESGIMPADDFAILRKIQWNWFAAKAYEPWVKKMKPADRMILLRPGGIHPGTPGLEWHYAATDTWIGRLPKQQ